MAVDPAVTGPAIIQAGRKLGEFIAGIGGSGPKQAPPQVISQAEKRAADVPAGQRFYIPWIGGKFWTVGTKGGVAPPPLPPTTPPVTPPPTTVSPGEPLPRPFYPPVPYKRKRKKPKVKIRTDWITRARNIAGGIRTGAYWGVGAEVADTIFQDVIPGIIAYPWTREADLATDEAERLGRVLQVRTANEAARLILERGATTRRAVPTWAKPPVARPPTPNVRSGGRTSPAAPARPDLTAQVEAQIRSAQVNVGSGTAPALGKVSSGFALPRVPPWLLQAGTLAPLVGLLPSARSRQLGVIGSSGLPRAPGPQESFDNWSQYLVQPGSNRGGRGTATADEVCSCRPRYPKKRKRKSTRKICYERKL